MDFEQVSLKYIYISLSLRISGNLLEFTLEEEWNVNTQSISEKWLISFLSSNIPSELFATLTLTLLASISKVIKSLVILLFFVVVFLLLLVVIFFFAP